MTNAMNSIIKTMRLDDRPIVLHRPKPSENLPCADSEGRVDERSANPGGEPVAPADVSGSSYEHEEPVPDERMTYEEFKQRFEEELLAWRREARQDGVERGLAEGRERAAAEYAEELAALASLVAAARASLDRAVDGLAEIGVEIVWEAVCKIIGQTMTDRDAVVAVVQEVVRRTKDRAQLVVRVSPTDWTIIAERRAQLLEGLNAGAVDIVADERVELGGCLVETRTGGLDGRLEVQLDRLREILIHTKGAMSSETEAAA